MTIRFMSEKACMWSSESGHTAGAAEKNHTAPRRAAATTAGRQKITRHPMLDPEFGSWQGLRRACPAALIGGILLPAVVAAARRGAV